MKLIIGLFLISLLVSLATLRAQSTLPATHATERPRWLTARGNPERTGCIDNLPGPVRPRLLWSLKSQDSFIAAAVPAGDRIFVAGLSGFDIATIYGFCTEQNANRKEPWTLTTPTLKLPVVSSPAIVDSLMIFGDGMHQTDGGVLHCIQIGDRLPLWQLALSGALVHFEGAPTVQGGRVYVGAGSAGVLCVRHDCVNLGGATQDLGAVRKLLQRDWQAMCDKYESERKKDPDFAAPPDQDKLPKPEPVRVWQQGEGRWHVDAPVAVVGNQVLATTAYLEKEKIGLRAAVCMDADTGRVKWSTPLHLNPWAGPSALGHHVVIGGSTINYDPGALKGARGDVVALDLETGAERWRREVDGGVLASVALAGGLAIATATDGKIRAFDLKTGASRWVYRGRTAFFAPPAVAGGFVYAGDLDGVIHAINFNDGVSAWTFDLRRELHVPAPGMIYGGPVVQGRHLFVATCHAQGAVNQPSMVVCVGDP